MSKNKNNSAITMECHVCGREWLCVRPNYKIMTIKTKGGKYWRQFTAFCPTCKREITTTVPMENKSYKK